MKLISIVIPVFNERDNVFPLYREIDKFLLLDFRYEIFFICDGSNDGSFEAIKRICQEDHRVKGIRFTRNFGQQVALACGLEHANGDAVITMDGDFQHRPELLPLLIRKWQAGEKVVQVLRKDSMESFFKKYSSFLFYKIIEIIEFV